jgi:hypothetical protein
MKSICDSKSFATRGACAFAFLAASLLVSQLLAMPPHPDDQGKIQYPTPLPNPLLNHSHVGGIPVKEVNPSAFGNPGPHMVDTAATQTWRTYAAGDNRTYFNGDAAGQPYGHGYIEPTDATRPRYAFGANTPGGVDLTNIEADIQSIWQSWETAAKSQGQDTRTTPDGTPLATGLSFREQVAADAGAKEIDIDFGGTTFGVWQPGAQTLRFTLTPKVNVFVSTPGGAPNADWQVSSDNLALNGAKAWAAQTPQITLPWNFTNGAPTTAGVPNGGDLDYKCVNALGCGAGAPFNSTFEGTEAAFLALGLNVADSAGGAVIGATDAPIVQADFISVALHEWGHIIGLDHVTPATATMNAASPFTLGVLTRTIDLGSAKGAAVLYSIPVPEPTAVVLGFFALCGLIGVRRR